MSAYKVNGFALEYLNQICVNGLALVAVTPCLTGAYDIFVVDIEAGIEHLVAASIALNPFTECKCIAFCLL